MMRQQKVSRQTKSNLLAISGLSSHFSNLRESIFELFSLPFMRLLSGRKNRPNKLDFRSEKILLVV